MLETHFTWDIENQLQWSELSASPHYRFSLCFISTQITYCQNIYEPRPEIPEKTTTPPKKPLASTSLDNA